MLENYINISKSLEKLFTPYLEIVIHDLNLKKITYIANNISNRQIGEDSNLSDIKFDNSQNIIGPYEKINYDGKGIIKSKTIYAYDNKGLIKQKTILNADNKVIYSRIYTYEY